MSNIQSEPMWDWSENLRAILKAQFSWLKTVIVGWPDIKYLQVDTNLPALAIVDISETGQHAVSQYAVSGYTPISGGQGNILSEKMRLKTLVQLTLFTNTKLDRDQKGWALKQWLIANPHLQLLDYTLATPAPVATGEYMLTYFRGDHKEERGEANFYRRDLTFEIQARVLDAQPGYPVTGISLTQTVGRNVAPVLHPIGTSDVTSESHTVDGHGNPIDTITAS